LLPESQSQAFYATYTGPARQILVVVRNLEFALFYAEHAKHIIEGLWKEAVTHTPSYACRLIVRGVDGKGSQTFF